jgi:hypothetical protein
MLRIDDTRALTDMLARAQEALSEITTGLWGSGAYVEDRQAKLEAVIATVRWAMGDATSPLSGWITFNENRRTAELRLAEERLGALPGYDPHLDGVYVTLRWLGSDRIADEWIEDPLDV